MRSMLKLSERNEELQELYKGVVLAIGKLAEGQRATDEKLLFTAIPSKRPGDLRARVGRGLV